MGLPWFRCYVDFLEDPKMVGLAFEDQRHFLAVCALKAKGTLDQNCTPDMLNRIVSQNLWIDYAIIGDVKKRLIDAGLIDEFWQPLAWEKRQAKSDSSTERVRRHREAKRECNADETLQDRSGNGTDKKRVEEKRKEKKPAEFYEQLRHCVDEGLFLDFLKHRTKAKAPNTERAMTILTNKILSLKAEGHDPNRLIETAIERGWKTVFPDDRVKAQDDVGRGAI